MITHEEIEEFICQYPVYQYAFFPPEEIEFSFRVRWICEKECERYNSTWACPPAVGSVEECRKRCLGYRECFLFSTIAEVSDVINFEETLATRKEHEAITAAIESFIRQRGSHTWPFHRILRHLRILHLSPGPSLPFSGKNAPLCGKSRNHRF